MGAAGKREVKAYSIISLGVVKMKGQTFQGMYGNIRKVESRNDKYSQASWFLREHKDSQASVLLLWKHWRDIFPIAKFM